MAKRLFDRHFQGKDNAGLRKQIRETADAAMPACGPVVQRAVLALASSVALTAQGRAALVCVAADYRAANGESSPRCACESCVAGGLQRLGALG